MNELQRRWMQEQEAKIAELSEAVATTMKRLEQLGGTANEHVQDNGYLDLVRCGLRVWDEATRELKRDRIRQTLTNRAFSSRSSPERVFHYRTSRA